MCSLIILCSILVASPASADEDVEYILYLYPGWNFISVPLWLAEDHNTGSIFDAVDTAGHPVWTYDARTGLWSPVGNQTIIPPGTGIWIYANGTYQISLVISPEQPAITTTFYRGWNTFGSFGPRLGAAENTFIAIDDKWERIMGYQVFQRRYDVLILNGAIGEYSENQVLYPTKGYWIFITEDTPLTTEITR